MTDPQSITVSLEWAKKLQTARYPDFDCAHYYVDGELMSMTKYGLYHAAAQSYITGFLGMAKRERCYAAPTAGELIRKIPIEMRGMVPKEKLDDPNEWAKCYCDIQPTSIRLS